MTVPARVARGSQGVAATAFPAATEAALLQFGAGGNAIDAAVAAAWALAVCEPAASGLGGQTVLLIRLQSGRQVVVDGCSRAPAAVSEASVSEAAQRRGHRACTVPTTPATLAFVQRRYGRLTLAATLQPAIRLAEEGYALTGLQVRQQEWCRSSLAATPAARSFCLRGDSPYRPGELFRQPRLAAALRRIAEHGVEDFYEGEIAAAIVADMRAFDGLLDAADLAGLVAPTEREPWSVRYRGRRVLTIPPPGGGTEVLLALQLLERLGEADLYASDPGRWYERLAAVTHAVFAEREKQPAHPDGWSPELARRRLGRERVGLLAGRVADGAEAALVAGREEAGETTHLCTADARGNVVSLTQSIQSLFGAKVANSRYGFLYNNYLTTCPRRPHRYQLRGRGLVRSNAAPTLLLEDQSPLSGPGGRPLLTVGAAGSRRIVSAILAVLSGWQDRGLSLERAVGGPRVHALLSRRVWLEAPAATPGLATNLARRFGSVEIKPEHSYTMGAAQAIEFEAGGGLVAAADPRRDGAAGAAGTLTGPSR